MILQVCAKVCSGLLVTTQQKIPIGSAGIQCVLSLLNVEYHATIMTIACSTKLKSQDFRRPKLWPRQAGLPCHLELI
jgi:hypothetical protein